MWQLLELGNPQRFFSQLREYIGDLECIEFADHHRFSASDLPANIAVLMTTKDAVKCRQFSADNFWEVPAEPLVSEPFLDNFLSRLKDTMTVIEST